MKKYRFGAEMSFFRAKVYGIAQMCFVLCCHHSRRLKGNAQRVVKLFDNLSVIKSCYFRCFIVILRTLK